jgi:hypothetical protein
MWSCIHVRHKYQVPAFCRASLPGLPNSRWALEYWNCCLFAGNIEDKFGVFCPPIHHARHLNISIMQLIFLSLVTGGQTQVLLYACPRAMCWFQNSIHCAAQNLCVGVAGCPVLWRPYGRLLLRHPCLSRRKLNGINFPFDITAAYDSDPFTAERLRSVSHGIHGPESFPNGQIRPQRNSLSQLFLLRPRDRSHGGLNYAFVRSSAFGLVFSENPCSTSNISLLSVPL